MCSTKHNRKQTIKAKGVTYRPRHERNIRQPDLTTQEERATLLPPTLKLLPIIPQHLRRELPQGLPELAPQLCQPFGTLPRLRLRRRRRLELQEPMERGNDARADEVGPDAVARALVVVVVATTTTTTTR